jgi:hypothetical protein
MISRIILLSIILTSGLFAPSVFAEPTVNIVMEETSYSYCERLFYIIEVSEVTGDPAIIHIRDESGKGSSAIPIQISNLQNPVPSLIAFEKEIFPIGKYFVDVQYSGAEFTAEFELIDSDNICIPQTIKQFLIEWLNEKLSDGYLIDAMQKYVDIKLIEISFEINEDNINDIDIPDWVKNIAYWWIQGGVSDKELSEVINYLINQNIITTNTIVSNEI